MSKSKTTQLWEERLQRFESSGTTAAAFCAAEGVSQASYYHWRRKLRGPKDQRQPRNTPPIATFLPVSLKPDAASSDQTRRPDLSSLPDRLATPEHSTRARTTIELPGGIRIEIEVPTNPVLQLDCSTSSVEDRS